MKKVILLVPMIIAVVACSKKYEQVEPNENKNIENVFDERKYRVQRDTLHGVDEQTGELYMIVEETKIYE